MAILYLVSSRIILYYKNSGVGENALLLLNSVYLWHFVLNMKNINQEKPHIWYFIHFLRHINITTTSNAECLYIKYEYVEEFNMQWYDAICATYIERCDHNESTDESPM